jgi:hypothetical protein
MTSRVRLAVVALPAVGLGAVGIVDALDCEGRLVTMGIGPWDVQTICGDPVPVSDTVEVVLKPVHNLRATSRGTCRSGVPKQVWA